NKIIYTDTCFPVRPKCIFHRQDCAFFHMSEIFRSWSNYLFFNACDNFTLQHNYTTMKKLLLVLATVTGLQFTAGAQLNGALTQRLNDVFDSVCNELKLKGATAAVVVPGQGVWERAHGIS